MGTKFTFLVPMLVILASSYQASAQHSGEKYRIGVFGTAGERVQGVFVEPLRSALRAAGYIEGRNIVLDVHFGNGNTRRIAEQAAELARRKVDVIVAFGTASAQAVANESKTIPIVVAFGTGLLRNRLIASIAKPGGNVTGLTTRSSELVTKWLQLTKETLPETSRVAVLFNPRQSSSPPRVKAMKSAAARIGVTIQEVPVRVPGDFEEAFAAMARADALIMLPGRVVGSNRQKLIALAGKERIPTMCWRQALVRLGCFMSYGANRAHMVRRSASYVVKILRGANPADLPVERPVKFDFAINLKTAKALGITVPPSILLRATEVIE